MISADKISNRTDSKSQHPLEVKKVKPDSSDNRVKFFGRFLTRLDNVIDEETLVKVNSDIDQLPYCLMGDAGHNATRWRPRIHFLEECHIDENQSCVDLIFEVSDGTSPTPAIKEMIKQGMEKVAALFNWKNRRVKANVNIIRYILTSEKPSAVAFSWHRDANHNLTMTVLISPYNSKGIGFRGGSLGFSRAMGTRQECRDLDRQGKPTHDEKSVKTFEYSHSGGFLFENINSEHKVNDIHLVNTEKLETISYERRLFTIFFKNVSEKEIQSLADNPSIKNEVEADIHGD